MTTNKDPRSGLPMHKGIAVARGTMRTVLASSAPLAILQTAAKRDWGVSPARSRISVGGVHMNSRESLEQAVPTDQAKVDTIFDPDRPERARMLSRFVQEVDLMKQRIRARLAKWAREDAR